MKRLLPILLVIFLCSGLLPVVSFCQSLVFKSGDAGYATFRIPAIIQSPNKHLLAFCEGRLYGLQRLGVNQQKRTWRVI